MLNFLIRAFILAITLGAASAAGAQSEQAKLKVTGLQCLDSNNEVRQDQATGAQDICQIGDRVIAAFSGLGDWLDQSDKHKLANLVLSVDGEQLTGLSPNDSPVVNRVSPPSVSLIFRLTQTAGNRDDWRKVLVRSKLTEPKSVILGVAEKGTAKTFGSTEIRLRVASNFRITSMGIIYAALIGTFLYFVRTGSLLRDIGPATQAEKRPFSMASTQMAAWFFIILFGFVYLWMVTGALDTLTEGVLALAGISAATGLTATAIGSGKPDKSAEERAALEIEQVVLKRDLDGLGIKITASSGTLLQSNIARLTRESDEVITMLSRGPNLDLEAKKATLSGQMERLRADLATAQETNVALVAERSAKNASLDAVNARLGELPTASKPRVSRGFFKDILSNHGEVTFSRVQIMAWTIVLGIVFLHAVVTTLAMPEFNAMLLGLLGISSGTYVGFKFPKAPNG